MHSGFWPVAEGNRVSGVRGRGWRAWACVGVGFPWDLVGIHGRASATRGRAWGISSTWAAAPSRPGGNAESTRGRCWPDTRSGAEGRACLSGGGSGNVAATGPLGSYI